LDPFQPSPHGRVGFSANPQSAQPDPARSGSNGWAEPNLIYLIIIFFKKKEKISNFPKGILKIFVGPSHVFPTISHNFRLYIYIVRYRSGIKILGFLRNFYKKIKNLKNSEKKN